MALIIVDKNEDAGISLVNLALGESILPGMGLLFALGDIPCERDRTYTLALNDGSSTIVDKDTFERYQVGDEYP